jgi:hypothetical protein
MTIDEISTNFSLLDDGISWGRRSVKTGFGA